MSQTIKSLVEPFRFYPGGPLAVLGEVKTKARRSLRKRLEAAGIGPDDADHVVTMAEAVFLSRLTADEALGISTSEEAAALAGEVGEREREYLGQFFRVPRSAGQRNEAAEKGRTGRKAGRVAIFKPRE